jgi:Uma2 family endonuclease
VSATLTTRRFTVDEYYRMAEIGILREGERVELIEGEIVRMAAIGSEHSGCVMRLDRILQRGVDNRGLVLVQNPVRLDGSSEPEPDLALLRPRQDDYTTGHPGPADVLLVIEVADSSLEKDREIKAPLYARAGIVEYWLVNLPERKIEVYREPAGGTFGSVGHHRGPDVLRPLAFPELEVRVDAVLP